MPSSRPSLEQTKSDVMRWLSILLQRRRGQLVRRDGARRRPHAVAGGVAQELVVLFEQPAQVAVGNAAEQATGVVYDRSDAETLLRHLVDRLAHRRRLVHRGQRVAGVHELVDSQEALAEAAAGVEAGEVIGREAAGLEQRHGQSVAEREGRGGRGGRREVERAGLLVDRRVEMDVGVARRGLCGLPVIATSGMASRLTVSTSRSSSSVVPE